MGMIDFTDCKNTIPPVYWESGADTSYGLVLAIREPRQR